MKILQVSTELIHSGAEKIVYDLSVGIKEKGHQVQVACVKDTRGKVGDWLQEQNIPVYWLDLNYRNPFYFLYSLVKFIRFVRKERFDLIHAHQFHANVVARLARVFFKTKIVSSVHLVERRNRPWHFWFDHWSAFLCDKEICVSQAVRDFTYQKVPNMRNKLEVIYNGIEVKENTMPKDSIREKFSIPKDIFLFGSVGRLYPQKGYVYLLEAFLEVSKINEKIGLLIVGEGPDRGEIESFIKKNHLEQKVWLVGYQENPRPFYDVMDCFVLASLFEGFGLVLAEAMLCCVPIVATRVDSIPEIVKNDDYGLLCEAGNAKDLAEKMALQYTRKLDKEDLRHIAEYARTEFSPQKMCEKHMDLYARI